MDIKVTSQNYQEIVNKYGKIIESINFMLIFGASESLLPYPKEVIKDALKIALQFESQKEKQDNNLIEALKNGYINLASFIPLEVFRKIEPIYDVNIEHFLDNKSPDAKNFLLNSSKEILAKSGILLEEVNIFCSKLKIITEK